MSGGSLLSSLARLRLQFAGLRWSAAIVVIPLALYGWYVARQFQQLEEQSQRDLGHAALVLQSTVDKALVNVANLGDNAAFLCQFISEQPYLEMDLPCKEARITDANAVPRLLALPGGLQIAYGKGDELTFGIRVDLLFREISFPESFQFLSLINNEGLVLFSADSQQPVWLRQLRLDETEFREPAFSDRPPLLLRDLKSAAKPTFEEARASASRFRVQLAGKAYQVYLQPLRFQVPGTSQEQQLLLAGFRPTMEVLRQSLAFDTYLLAFLLLVIGGLCLSYPFLKLWAMHPTERFRIRDLLFLYLSTGALLSLCVTVILAVDGYARYQALAAEILPALHTRLETQLLSELRAARRQLVAYDNCTASLDLTSSLPSEPVQVDQVAWVDAAGMQTGKITATKEKAELVSVAHRTYFRAVASGAQWLMPTVPSDPASSIPFYFGPSRSITDGQFFSFLSVHSGEANCAPKPPAANSVAAVLTFSLNSLAPRPLPATFGFALFNRESTVLYHSDDRLSLRQNLIQETDEPARLRAILLAGGPGWIDMHYLGRPHRFLIRPVTSLRPANGQSGGMLYLAVFQDLSPVRVIATQAFLTSMLWPQAILALLMALAIGAALLTSRMRTEEHNGLQWLWTETARGPQYRVAALLLLGATILAVTLQVAQVTWIPSLLLPAAAAVTAIVVAVWLPLPAVESCTAEFAARWHRRLLFLLAVAMSAVPAAALYQLIWGQELGKLFAYERTQAAALSSDLPVRTRLRLVRERIPPSWVNRAYTLRQAYMPMDLTVSARDGITLPAPQGVQFAQNHVSWALPMRNEVATSLRGLAGPPFAPAWAGFGPIPRGVPVALALAVLLWLLHFWTRWNARNILLSGFDPVRVPLQPDELETAWNGLTPEERSFLVQVALENIANPKRAQLFLSLVAKGWLDLRPAHRPASPAVRAFLLHPSRLPALEHENRVLFTHSWQSVRASLVAGLALAVLFLFVTQPALPLDFLGLPSFVVATLGAVVKWSDQLNNLLATSPKEPA